MHALKAQTFKTHSYLLLDESSESQGQVLCSLLARPRIQNDVFECVRLHQNVKDIKMQLHMLIASLYVVFCRLNNGPLDCQPPAFLTALKLHEFHYAYKADVTVSYL